MSLHNPLSRKPKSTSTASTVPSKKKKETARVSLTSLDKCPVCQKPMLAVYVQGTLDLISTFVCLEHRVCLPADLAGGVQSPDRSAEIVPPAVPVVTPGLQGRETPPVTSPAPSVPPPARVPTFGRRRRASLSSSDNAVYDNADPDFNL